MTSTWGTVAGSVTVRSVNACGQSSARSKSVSLATCIEGGESDLLRTILLEAYPNPNNGSFIVRSSDGGDFHLMNSVGQLLEVIKLNETNNFRAEIVGLSSGIYFLNGTVSGTTVTERIVVTGN
jgi:hypothetical protein